jgi:hypothetical protein
MMPEDKIEEQFEKLIDYLKWSAKIVRKIFTPEAFNYPFWFPVFEKDERIPRSKISYTDIQKGKFIFPDGIHPIIEVVQDVDLVEYIRTGDKKKLKRNVKLRVIVREDNPEGINMQDITIVDDGTDKNFIKNWEKVFGEEIFLLRSDIILFLVAQNGTLEIRSFSMSKDNLSNNYGKVDLTKWDYDRVKFGVDLLMNGNISPFGNTKIRQHYFLSYLFLRQITRLLWNYSKQGKKLLQIFLEDYSKTANNEEKLKKLEIMKNDEYWLAKDIRNFTKELWTEDMFQARRKFLYINSINLEENKNLLEIWEEKKRLINEIRTNPDKYLPILSPKPLWKTYEEFLYGKGIRIYNGLYLITQYRINSEAQLAIKNRICNCIVLKNKYGAEVVIHNLPEALVNYYKGLVDTKDETKGKIGLVFSWPLGGSYDNYLTFFSINAPFNPYIEKDGNLYIPDEIVELLLDALEPEPKIAEWIKTKAKEDQEALYKRLYDVLYELERGELSNDTVYAFDNAGEEDADKRKRMESWKKEEEKKEKTEYYIKQTKTEEEEQQKEVFEIKEEKEEEKEQKFEELKPEAEIHEEEEQEQLQTSETRYESENEIVEKIKQYLNSEDYKQELIFALQKLLEENPEYKEFNEFAKEYYSKLLVKKNVPNAVKEKVKAWWSVGKSLFYAWLSEDLKEGVYLIVNKWYEKVPGENRYWHRAYIISRGTSEKYKVADKIPVVLKNKPYTDIPYTVHGLVYFVLYNKKDYFITTELPKELYTYLYCGTSDKVCIWMPEMVFKAIWPIFQKMTEKIKREILEPVMKEQKVIEKLKPVEEPKIEKQIEKPEQKEEKISEEPKLHEEEVKIDKEQEITTEKPRRKKEEKQETHIDKEQKETTEKPKRKKKEEKISEPQQEKEKKEEKIEEKTEIEKTTEEIEEEIKEQDIIEELEGADVDVKAKVRSKVQITLPKEMIKEKKKKITKRNKTKKSKKKKR